MISGIKSLLGSFHINRNAEIQKKSYENFHTSLHFINNMHTRKFDYQTNSKEAYCKNVVAYRAINLIATAAASVPWKLFQKQSKDKIELREHPLLALLQKPNHYMAGAEFFEQLFAYKLIAGEAFVKIVLNGTIPKELHLLRPDRVNVEIDKNGLVSGYRYKINQKEIFYPVNKISGKTSVLHIKNFNPTDDLRGLSPLAAAAASIDQYNESSSWNLSMLKNAARPSGALIVKSNGHNDSYLTDDQFEDLREQLNEIYTSSSNTGRPILLQGGLEWQEMSLSPKDMDFIESKHSNARDIALCLGVPPQLLGIPGDNTYNNYQEARLAFWEDTIIPILDDLVDALNNWLTPQFANNLMLTYDLDEVSALSSKREKLWSKLENASFLTTNEKRRIIGLSPINKGDELCNIKD